MQTLFTLLIRLVLLAAGLVVAASLMVVMTAIAVAWGLRYAWARLTGRPVTPFVVRVDPLAGFGRIYRGEGQGGARAQPKPKPVHSGERVIGDVTDVEPKRPRDRG